MPLLLQSKLFCDAPMNEHETLGTLQREAHAFEFLSCKGLAGMCGTCFADNSAEILFYIRPVSKPQEHSRNASQQILVGKG